MNRLINLTVMILLLLFAGYMEAPVAAESKYDEAIFAGGCFWCMEHPFEKIDGVVSVVSGYTGGKEKNPTYEEVSSGSTGHTEAVKITFDPERVKYEQLLEVFWKQIDPTDEGGQFADRGQQYRTAIFFMDENQKRLAVRSRLKVTESGRFQKKIVTPILKAGPFYNAESYHQDYYLKNPVRYKMYRTGSGRETYLKKVWGDKQMSELRSSEQVRVADDEELKKKLTPLQYHVVREDGTEPAFDNEYWNNKSPGIYVDIVSGEVLFSSSDKYDSKTGWPSFTKPLEEENIVEVKDNSFFMERVEVRSKNADSHLGHVFNDGPMPTGRRYCINSAALRFIPYEDLEAEGYGRYIEHLK